jgi:hypothetical protein
LSEKVEGRLGNLVDCEANHTVMMAKGAGSSATGGAGQVATQFDKIPVV